MKSAVSQLRTIAILALCAQPLLGGVVLDGSFGRSGAVPSLNNDFAIQAAFGKRVGGNLFQSFSQFNLNSSQSATFMGPSNVHNILARVTSGSPSSIDGTIDSDIRGANLFFMNPAGVMFGQHAQLDVSGSFAVTTANYLKLAGGGRFNANLGGGDVLTSAPVSSFGFLNSAPAPVSIASGNNTRDSKGSLIPGLGGLSIAPHQSFSVVAGDIALNGGTVRGQGSRVNLVSVKSPGEVQLDATNINSPLDVSRFTAFGTISLSNLALIDASGPGGGPVVLRAGNLYLDSSDVLAQTTGSIHGGTIDIVTTQNMRITNAGVISSTTTSSGDGGNITIHAGSLDMDSQADIAGKNTGVFSRSEKNATGEAGDVTITVDDTLSIVSGSEISTATFASGQGGDLTIHAGSLLIDNSLTNGERTPLPTIKDINGHPVFVDLLTGISAAATQGRGNAGNIDLNVTGAVRMIGHGQIFDGTLATSTGDGGNLSISAGSLSIDDTRTDVKNVSDLRIIDISADTRGSGDAGNLTIKVDHALSILPGGQISASTFSDGNAGDLSIHAGSLLIHGMIHGSKTVSVDTGIFANSGGISALHATPNARGNAGNVTITVDNALSIVAGGLIGSSTFSHGNGGSINIRAGSVLIDGMADISGNSTAIASQSLRGATGNAGDITVMVDGALTIRSGSGINAGTFTTGQGGNVTVQSGSLLIDNTLTDGSPTSLPVDKRSGPVDLLTGITASAFLDAKHPFNGTHGSAGNVNIAVDGELKMVGHGQIFDGTLSSGNGGDLNIKAGSLSIDDSRTDLAPILKFLSRRVDISAETQGSGHGGNVNITVDHALRIVGSGEIAVSTSPLTKPFQVSGDAGNLSIQARSLLIDGFGMPNIFTGIAATSAAGANGNAGDVTIRVDHALHVIGGGEISASTSSANGNGGSVSIAADSVLIDGVNSQISSTTSDSGNAGDIVVHAGKLKIKNRGTITTTSSAAGNAGSITVHAHDMKMNDGNVISSSTSSGAAGSIGLTSRGTIRLRDHSFISVSALLNGGNITIKAPVLVSLINSDINAKAGKIGGNITIDPIALQLKNSTISASAPHGQGGHIDLFTSFLVGPVEAVTPGVISLAFRSSITATGETANGTVNITAPALDLGAELITLPTSVLSAENQLQERCTALLQGDFSSFISIGRGGTEPAPDELQSTF
jgi:filamentous hemagglutinin family protein